MAVRVSKGVSVVLVSDKVSAIITGTGEAPLITRQVFVAFENTHGETAEGFRIWAQTDSCTVAKECVGNERTV